MATIAKFQIPASDTALGATFEDIPSLVCEMEQAIAIDDFGIWLSGADISAINSALEADSTVTVHSVIRSADESWLYNIRFSDEIIGMISLIVEEGGTALKARAKNGRWTVELRFPTREDVSQVYEQLRGRDVQVDVVQIQPFSKDTADEIRLTPAQSEALLAAIQHGYFEIPREISQEELATELEISHQALSERFRRGFRTLATTEIKTAEKDRQQSIGSIY
ncbi:bacterio-opsin activator domain-containing protein [Natrinema amylolyticum]|uniref:helix-turn-helix domain-containing protein n=1 Tax=Natrinema amylolyticum TaxID=2878679 RepID=UPI001CFA2E2A|nr:helix-turn-helix domain-containing protein [Natrinema amylolyticum]